MTELNVWKRRLAIIWAAIGFFTLWAMNYQAPPIALFLTKTQDLAVLFLLLLSWPIVLWWQPRSEQLKAMPPGWMLALAGILLVVLLRWGTSAIMANLPLSRDEQMVPFDMAIFDSGRFAMPVAPQWRGYAIALVPEFLLNGNHPQGFASTYLPLNALLRLAFSKLADPAWFNPLLAVIGGAALFDIAKRIFPADPRAQIVALLIYASSAQLLANAMTTYSMTGHLALNLVWLAAFLRGGKWGHSTAIAVGAIAIGYHQLVFHPFFVAPFLLWKLREKQWRIVLVYALAYSAIVLGWAYYSSLIFPLVAGPPSIAVTGNFWTERVLPLLVKHDPGTVGLMILNLLRFTAWQNLALLPLLAAAIPAARGRGLPRTLLFGILLWTAFLAFILPSQGRGWGYRYLSPYLGSFALLAGYGYQWLRQRIGQRADGLVAVLTAITVGAAIPWQLATARGLVAPHSRVEDFIDKQRTPIVLIDDDAADTSDGLFGENGVDHVRNRPDLSNGPLRIGSRPLNVPMLVALCRRGAVTVVTRADFHQLGFMLNVPARNPRLEGLTALAARQAPGCFRSAIHPAVRR